jgi:hypothetical protein
MLCEWIEFIGGMTAKIPGDTWNRNQDGIGIFGCLPDFNEASALIAPQTRQRVAT